jgi:hypothetical protein
MSIAAAHANQFYEQVVRERAVFSFTDDGSLLVYPVKDREVVPFWSSRARLDRVQREHPKYRNYVCKEIPLSEFLEETLPTLAREHIAAGINWSGPGLTGYDITVADLLRNLEYWEKKLVAGDSTG